MGKGFITHITYVRALSSTYTLMSFRTTLMGKGFIKHVTYVRTLFSMYRFVGCHFILTLEAFTTQITGTRIIIILPQIIFGHIFQVTERHITHITVIWSLLSMNGLWRFKSFWTANILLQSSHLNGRTSLCMRLKWTLTSRFKANAFLLITGIWTLMIVRAEDAHAECSNLCRNYYTHCMKTDALQYADVDVSSDYSYHRFTYHTQYMSTETAVCVCASDFWM